MKWEVLFLFLMSKVTACSKKSLLFIRIYFLISFLLSIFSSNFFPKKLVNGWTLCFMKCWNFVFNFSFLHAMSSGRIFLKQKTTLLVHISHGQSHVLLFCWLQQLNTTSNRDLMLYLGFDYMDISSPDKKQ